MNWDINWQISNFKKWVKSYWKNTQDKNIWKKCWIRTFRYIILLPFQDFLISSELIFTQMSIETLGHRNLHFMSDFDSRWLVWLFHSWWHPGRLVYTSIHHETIKNVYYKILSKLIFKTVRSTDQNCIWKIV